MPWDVVSVAGDMLRIFVLDRLGEAFNQTAVPLRYTPRKVVVDAPGLGVPDYVPPYESRQSAPALAARYPLAMISPPTVPPGPDGPEIPATL